MNELKGMLDTYKPCGIMYRPGSGAEMQKTHKFLQDNSEIPMLIAANLESGGNGIATDGTTFGRQMQVAATEDTDMAYKLGLVAGREGRAVGCNWAFAPVIDIDMNFRNPITNIRTYGSCPDRVLKMGTAYMKGIQETGLAVSIKHFPGDGVDDRDQHLVTSVNTLGCDEWEDTFGRVYKGLINEGARSLMVGHIMLPEYSKKLRPNIKDADIQPATLAPELLNDLLRDELGFNGLIVTDATPMVGFTMVGKREDTVPESIAAGCDMFLFNKSLEEDYKYMLQGLERGILTEDRLNEAVTRILAFKASLKLHDQKKDNTLVPSEEALNVLGCDEHQAWASECADQSVTLVKDTQDLLPLNTDDHKRILVMPLGDKDGYMGAGGMLPLFTEKMKAEGFEIEVFDRTGFTMRDLIQPVEDFVAPYDLVLYFANLETASNQTTIRIDWAAPMGIDAPWFAAEIPTAFVSVANPYHLQDVPRLKTFINGYTSSPYVVSAIVDKIVGKSEFKGKSPVDPFCGYWETRL